MKVEEEPGQPKQPGWWARKSRPKKFLWGALGGVIAFIVIVVAATSGGGEDATTADVSTTSTTESVAAVVTTEAVTTESVTSTTEAVETTTTSTEPTTTTEALETWSDGTYLVGTDIPAGLYKSSEPADLGYWQIAKDATGDLDSIIANDNITGQFYLEASDGQYVTLSRVTVAAAEELKSPAPVSENITGGVYLVGTDIPAGNYKGAIADGDMGYWQVATSPNGTLDSIVANANPTGQFYVEVKEGQYLKIVGSTISLAK